MLIDGNVIREYREKNGITIDEMADILALDGDTLSDYENGVEWEEDDDLRLFILNSITDGLDYLIPVSLDDLYGEFL